MRIMVSKFFRDYVTTKHEGFALDKLLIFNFRERESTLVGGEQQREKERISSRLHTQCRAHGRA